MPVYSYLLKTIFGLFITKKDFSILLLSYWLAKQIQILWKLSPEFVIGCAIEIFFHVFNSIYYEMGTNRSIFIESFTENSGFPAFATDVVPSSSVARKGNLFYSAMHTRFRLIFEFHIGHSKSKFNFDPFFKLGLKFFFPRSSNLSSHQIFTLQVTIFAYG